MFYRKARKIQKLQEETEELQKALKLKEGVIQSLSSVYDDVHYVIDWASPFHATPTYGTACGWVVSREDRYGSTGLLVRLPTNWWCMPQTIE